MLIAIGRQFFVGIMVMAVVGISAIFWPLDDTRPERKLAAAGGKLCFAHDETVLVGASLEGPEIGDDLVMIAAKIPSLQRLSLIESRVTKRGIQSLQVLQKLASLNISRTRWTVEALDDVASLQALRELRLDGCDWFGDDHLLQVVPLKNLEILSLCETSVTTEGIDQVRHLPRLRYLLLDRCPQIDDDSIETLISLCRDRHLNLSLSGTEITQKQLVRLRRAVPESTIQFRPESMTGLRAIGDRGQFITNDVGEIWGFRRRADIEGLIVPLRAGDLSIVGTVSELVELNLEHSNVDDVMLAELPASPRLETLRLTGTRITDRGLEKLAGFPNLLSLGLMENEIEGAGLATLQHLPLLANLRIQTQQGDEILRHLEPLTQLRMLTICAPLTNDGMEQLAKLPKLRYLALVGTDIRGAGIAKLAASETLSELRFDGGKIDDSDIDALANLASLKWLVLSQTRVTQQGRDRLVELRPDTAVYWSESALR